MPSAKKKSTKISDIHAHILANLEDLNTSHKAKKPLYFSKNLPFYTCIDSAKKIWTRETKDGKMVYVKRHLDIEKDVMVDTVVDMKQK